MLTAKQAVAWARVKCFSPSDIDCTTAVVLKIIDRKCKMESMDMNTVVVIYDVIKTQTGDRLGENTHQLIEAARTQTTDYLRLEIHKQRVKAESLIDKPIMKAYKKMLRHELLGKDN